MRIHNSASKLDSNANQGKIRNAKKWTFTPTQFANTGASERKSMQRCGRRLFTKSLIFATKTATLKSKNYGALADTPDRQEGYRTVPSS
jgi:hypothetical protein